MPDDWTDLPNLVGWGSSHKCGICRWIPNSQLRGGVGPAIFLDPLDHSEDSSVCTLPPTRWVWSTPSRLAGRRWRHGRGTLGAGVDMGSCTLWIDGNDQTPVLPKDPPRPHISNEPHPNSDSTRNTRQLLGAPLLWIRGKAIFFTKYQSKNNELIFVSLLTVYRNFISSFR